MDGIDTWQADELTAVTSNVVYLNSVLGEDGALSDIGTYGKPAFLFLSGFMVHRLLCEHHRVPSSLHMHLSIKNVLEKLLER